MNTLVWLSWSFSCVSTAIYCAPSVVVISCFMQVPVLPCSFIPPTGMFSSAKKKIEIRSVIYYFTCHHTIFLFHFVILLFENSRLQNTSLALCYLPLINKGTDEVSCPLHYSFCHQFIHVSICMYL